ncbi:hypothetical protein [Burkholderia ubonensis]|uniref:hypothetical protein n=1 Tax=Burkholderia ubonensis TaxID=101571 RepID=UPI0012FA554A|nr:hypothetical protein [Burkholderia ubonensis]
MTTSSAGGCRVVPELQASGVEGIADGHVLRTESLAGLRVRSIIDLPSPAMPDRENLSLIYTSIVIAAYIPTACVDVQLLPPRFVSHENLLRLLDHQIPNDQRRIGDF